MIRIKSDRRPMIILRAGQAHIQLPFDSNLSSNWKGFSGDCQWMRSWAWMLGCRQNHPWLLMGLSVALSMLGTWGMLLLACLGESSGTPRHHTPCQTTRHCLCQWSATTAYNTIIPSFWSRAWRPEYLEGIFSPSVTLMQPRKYLRKVCYHFLSEWVFSFPE